MSSSAAGAVAPAGPPRPPARSVGGLLPAVRGMIHNQVSSVAGALLLGTCVIAGTSLLINVISARVLAPVGRGELAFYMQLAYLLSAAFLCSFDRSYPAARHDRLPFGNVFLDLGRLLRPSAIVLVAGCGVVSVIAAVTGRLTTVAAPLVLAAVTLGTMGLNCGRAGAIVSRTSRSYLTIVGSAQLLLIGCCVGLAVAGVTDPVLWLGAYAFSLTVPQLIALIGSSRDRGRRRPTSRRRHLSAVRRLGFRIMPSTVANLAMLRADRLLLPILASTGQLGLYIVVATITETLVWPVQSYVDSSIPRWRGAALTTGLRPLRIYLRLLGYVLVVGLLVGVLGYLLVVPLFGAEYVESRQLVAPLVLASCLYCISRVGIGIGLAYNRARQMFVVNGSGMAVAVIGYVALIPAYGAVGAALGSLIGYGLAAVLSIAVAHRSTAVVGSPSGRR